MSEYCVFASMKDSMRMECVGAVGWTVGGLIQGRLRVANVDAKRKPKRTANFAESGHEKDTPRIRPDN